MARKFVFPNPANCKPKDPAVLCPAERVIAIYNQDSGETAQRISKNVRVWFAAKAIEKGWAGVHFLPEVQSAHGSGCVLWLPPQQINVNVNVTNKTLVLVADEE